MSDQQNTNQPEIIVPQSGKTPYCSICCAEPGDEHDDWCAGTGTVSADQWRAA